MPELALALWGTALVFAFGLRVALHRLETGTTGIVRPAESRFSAAWWGGILFEASMPAMAAGAAVDLAGGPGAVELLGSLTLQVVGALIGVAGIAAIVAAQAAMGAQWRIGVDRDRPTTLVTGGPFRVVRNPIYTAMIVAWGGIVLVDATPIVLAGYAALIAGIQIQVRRVEEPYLADQHGEAFRRYAAKVGRFVPQVGRLGD